MLYVDDFEEIANTFNDSDAHWWPFLFLRPAREQRLTTARVALLALLYGALAGTLGDLVLVLLGRRLHPLLVPVAVVTGCFALFRLVFAVSWNRRAGRLARRSVRSDGA